MKFSAKYILHNSTLSKTVPWLVISCLALIPVGRMAEAPLVLLALIGIKVLFDNFKSNQWDKPTLLFSLFFLCLWLPIIISAPDSYKLSKTFSLAIEYLRFYLSGLAVVTYCLNRASLKLINTACVLILSFWVFDALVQFFWGVDLFGYVYVTERLNGVFGHKIKLGLFLSVYSSFIVVMLIEKKYLFLSSLLNLLCVLVILLAGSRGGWIMYGVVLVAFLAYKWRNNLKMFTASIAVLLVCIMAGGTVLYNTSDGFATRMDRTLKIFNGDEKSIDQAISLRVPIWKTAWAMINAHPINGVGARAFRYAYPEYSAKDDIFLIPKSKDNDREIGALHSHQMQLEVLTETGLLGGLFFVGAMLLLTWYWLSRSGFHKNNMLPYALGLAAFFFPLNTHYALYSSSWAQVMYWFLPLYFAAGAIEHPLPEPSEE